MKQLFLLLCLLNVVFLFWQFHVGRLSPQPTAPVAPSTILLVEEYERAKRGAEIDQIIERKIARWQTAEFQWMLADLKQERWTLKPIAMPLPKKVNKPPIGKKPAEPIKPPTTPIVEKKCFLVGPFAEEAGAKKWLAKNALLSKEIVQKDISMPTDYQVYYPAAKTPEQSRVNKAMLNAKGLQDIWMIPEGELKGSYSLGVFREKQRAINFKNQLAEKEIKAELKQREKTEAQWFVKIKLEKAKQKQYEAADAKFASCPVD